MPVNTTHPLFDDTLDKWIRCRDVIAGSDAVKYRREKYLPRLEAMTKAEYNAYLSRALFDNMTARLLGGFSGVITRREPEIEYPPEMKPYFEDATMTGKSFFEIFKFVADEILTTGRVPLLVDKGEAGGRAYIVRYKGERLINWIQNGNEPVSMAVLEETHIQPSSIDRYAMETNTRFRSLTLTEGGYVVEIYEAPAGAIEQIRNVNGKQVKVWSKDPVLIASYIPNIKGTPWDEIPLSVITPTGVDLDIAKPPILDIADINLSHYRTSADLEQGRHWTSLPTAVVSGVEGTTELRIGSQTAWILPDEKAKAYFLEFTGQGLQSLEKALQEKQQQMVQFSSRLMDTSTRGSEAADAVKLRNMSDSATLSTMAYAIEAGLNRVYKHIAKWEEIDPNLVNINLHKDFVNTTLSAAEISALAKSFVDGSIDEETLVFNLKRGDLLPKGKSTMDITKPEVNPNAT